MMLRQTAQDFKGILSVHQHLAPERAADQFDRGDGEMREIAESLVLDLVAFAVGAPEEVGLVEFVLVAAGCGGYVYRAGAAGHVGNKNQRGNFLTTNLLLFLLTYSSSKPYLSVDSTRVINY